MKKQNGFTLVELVVALAILVIMASVLFQIYSNTLRGSNKAQVLASIKQNSQQAIDLMSKTIKSSVKVICVATDRSQIVTFQNGVYTRFGFFVPDTLTPANGYIYQDNVANCSNIKDTSAQILTDTNLNTGVSIDATALSDGFLVNSSAGFSDLVIIKFRANPGLGIASAFTNQIDSVYFQTTVALRGYTEIR